MSYETIADTEISADGPAPLRPRATAPARGRALTAGPRTLSSGTDYTFKVGTVGTVTVRVANYPIVGMAQVLDATLALPAGRWRLRSVVSATPASSAGPTVRNEIDTGSVGAGNRTLVAGATCRIHKPLDGSIARFYAAFYIDQWDGAQWVRYASGAHPSVALTAIGANIPAQRRGVNVHIYSGGETSARISTLLDAAKDMGFTTVRTSAPWAFIEQTAKGVQDATALAMLDAFFTKCNTIGLDVLLIAGGAATPLWARAAGAVASTTWQSQVYQYRNVGGAAPDSWVDYEDYVKWLINRYSAQRLVAVEASNEPNTVNWTTDDATVAAWSTHLYDAANASVAPGTLAVCGTLAYCDYAFLERMFVGGLGTKFDAISIHPYPFTWTVDGQPTAVWDTTRPLYEAAPWWHGHAGVEAIIDTMDAHTSGKPVWITECGTGGQWGPQGVSEALQGPQYEYMLRHLGRHPRVDAVIVHTMENRGDGTTWNPAPYNWSGNFGFLREDRVTKKPSYNILKAALAAMAV